MMKTIAIERRWIRITVALATTKDCLSRCRTCKKGNERFDSQESPLDFCDTPALNTTLAQIGVDTSFFERAVTNHTM